MAENFPVLVKEKYKYQRSSLNSKDDELRDPQRHIINKHLKDRLLKAARKK